MSDIGLHESEESDNISKKIFENIQCDEFLYNPTIEGINLAVQCPV